MAHYVLDARSATPHFPGIGRYVSNLAQALVPLLARDERLTVLMDPQHVFDLPVHDHVSTLPVAATPFSLSQQWVLPRLVKQVAADLYHTAYYLMPYAPGRPTLLTVHDVIPLRFPDHSTPRARAMFRVMAALALRVAKHVIAVSETTRADLHRFLGVGEDRVTVIPEAADPVFRPQPDRVICELRRRYDLPATYLLYLGSNKPHKNLTVLVEAWAQVLPSLSDVTLVIAGAWLPEYDAPRQRAEALSLNSAAVRWLGPMPAADLPALYSAAQAFVFPSLYEGFGLPVIEAMACGTPVACSHTAALQEVVGEAALLFDPTQPSAIAEALMCLLSNELLRVTLRERGLQKAGCFSWTRTAQETLALYRRWHAGR